MHCKRHTIGKLVHGAAQEARGFHGEEDRASFTAFSAGSFSGEKKKKKKLTYEHHHRLKSGVQTFGRLYRLALRCFLLGLPPIHP